MSTPSRRLAERIVNQLVSEGLITADDAGRLLPKLEGGKLRPEDWRLAVEKALRRETEHE